jgi:hypothetical protein
LKKKDRIHFFSPNLFRSMVILIFLIFFSWYKIFSFPSSRPHNLTLAKIWFYHHPIFSHALTILSTSSFYVTRKYLFSANFLSPGVLFAFPTSSSDVVQSCWFFLLLQNENSIRTARTLHSTSSFCASHFYVSQT